MPINRKEVTNYKELIIINRRQNLKRKKKKDHNQNKTSTFACHIHTLKI
jgi:hypothetical protein